MKACEHKHILRFAFHENRGWLARVGSKETPSSMKNRLVIDCCQTFGNRVTKQQEIPAAAKTALNDSGSPNREWWSFIRIQSVNLGIDGVPRSIQETSFRRQ